jgi:hypothetical protein
MRFSKTFLRNPRWQSLLKLSENNSSDMDIHDWSKELTALCGGRMTCNHKIHMTNKTFIESKTGTM